VIGQELKTLNLGTGKLRAEELRHKLDPFLKTAQMRFFMTHRQMQKIPDFDSIRGFNGKGD
jgi:hypothetical protein